MNVTAVSMNPTGAIAQNRGASTAKQYASTPNNSTDSFEKTNSKNVSFGLEPPLNASELALIKQLQDGLIQSVKIRGERIDKQVLEMLDMVNNVRGKGFATVEGHLDFVKEQREAAKHSSGEVFDASPDPHNPAERMRNFLEGWGGYP